MGAGHNKPRQPFQTRRGVGRWTQYIINVSWTEKSRFRLYYQLKQFMVDQIEAGVLKEGTGSLGRGTLQHPERQPSYHPPNQRAANGKGSKGRRPRERLSPPKIQGAFPDDSSFNDGCAPRAGSFHQGAGFPVTREEDAAVKLGLEPMRR